MGKSKKKVEDFKKVKLKVGKKLKKPTETDTTFKSGKVVLLEQLKRDSVGKEVPVTKRKLTLQDLLHNLRHYNSNIRKDGVIGLKELLVENPHLIRSNLGTLIEHLGPLFTDSESDILKTSASLWEIIFTHIDSATLAPYLGLLTAHLNCSMTHLNGEVKRFSLKILNLLLASHGILLRQASSFDMVNCFLNSLPHSKSTSSSGGGASRSLMTRASKHELLKVVKNILSIFDAETTTSEQESSFDVVQHHSSSSAILCVPLSRSDWTRNMELELDDYVRPLGSAPNEIERIVGFIDKIVPFCHALWIEVTSTEENESVDCFTFDLSTLVIMNDILSVYNSLLRRPVGQLVSAGNSMDDTDGQAFQSSVRKTMTKPFIDRYFNLLPCRRAPRKTGEEAKLSELNLNADPCSLVNFNLCRFLSYASVILEKQFPYPVKEIGDYLSYSLSGDKKRVDSQTLRCGLELVRDLRSLLSGRNGSTITEELQQHHEELGQLIMDSLLTQGGRWKMKTDVISWLCRDLEDLADFQRWPKFNEFIEKLPPLMSSLLDEMKKAPANVSSTSPTPDLLFRLTRILLLRKGTLPLDESVSKKAIHSDLLCLLLANIDRFSPESRKGVISLLYYAVPLKEEVVNAIKAMKKDQNGQEFDFLKRLLK